MVSCHPKQKEKEIFPVSFLFLLKSGSSWSCSGKEEAVCLWQAWVSVTIPGYTQICHWSRKIQDNHSRLVSESYRRRQEEEEGWYLLAGINNALRLTRQVNPYTSQLPKQMLATQSKPFHVGPSCSDDPSATPLELDLSMPFGFMLWGSRTRDLNFLPAKQGWQAWFQRATSGRLHFGAIALSLASDRHNGLVGEMENCAVQPWTSSQRTVLSAQLQPPPGDVHV